MPPKSTSSLPKKFKFKKHDKIGAADALEDQKWLYECFIDTGELNILQDVERPECIVLGRTGAGKTALLEMLDHNSDNSVFLNPDNLALSYLSNNEALRFFMDIGVDLNLFFRVLWRHIFISEIIKLHFDLSTIEKTQGFITLLKNKIFPNRTREIARDYLIKRGENFWRETDYRIKEFTKKLETDLGTSVSAKLEGGFPGFAKGEVNLEPNLARRMSQEQKVEIRNLGQAVVNKVQMREISEVLRLIEEDLLLDRQKQYYILIDRLDENWIHDDFRYRLIRALFETARDLNNQLSTVKVVLAIREDLLNRVFRFTRDEGDQQEKYKSLYLNLSWKENELKDLLIQRVNQLVRNQYVKSAQVQLKDIFPKRIRKRSNVFKYLVERTLLMPRDLILFFNECIVSAENDPSITQAQILSAEGRFSELRLRALADEWSSDYPNLIYVIFYFKKYPTKFRLKDISFDVFDDYIMNILMLESINKSGYFYRYTYNRFEAGDWDLKSIFIEYSRILFRVGFLGIKREKYLETYWSFMGQQIMEAEIDDEAQFCIHPAFYRVLGINDDE